MSLSKFSAKSILKAGAAGLVILSAAASAHAAPTNPAALTEGKISHVMVIELENESESAWYLNPSMTYTNSTLLPQGEFIANYYATSHVSLGNYISQVSGQEPTVSTNDDCINLGSLSHPPVVGSYNNVSPGNDDSNQSAYPGQVDGDGCVYPAPTLTSNGAPTIGAQLDEKYRTGPGTRKTTIHWREYAEDMGNDPVRDYGDVDPQFPGRDCAHPPLGGADLTNSAEAGDQYADRHAPFVYFHTTVDDDRYCDLHVVPLGTVQANPDDPNMDVFSGHLYQDLRSVKTTPDFMWVTPNLCDDGHDGNPPATCAGTNIEGGNAGGLVGIDLWLKHYMPMIFASPAYRNGSLLVVVTFDEGGDNDTTACPNVDQSTCGSPIGPNVSNPGYSTILGLYGYQTPPTANYVYPAGGKIGAMVFNRRYVARGSINTIGYYNHYSALRSFEDLLGLTTGGADGAGHLGYASGPNVVPFGTDVFNVLPR
jgi:hypothetical protein